MAVLLSFLTIKPVLSSTISPAKPVTVKKGPELVLLVANGAAKRKSETSRLLAKAVSMATEAEAGVVAGAMAAAAVVMVVDILEAVEVSVADVVLLSPRGCRHPPKRFDQDIILAVIDLLPLIFVNLVF